MPRPALANETVTSAPHKVKPVSGSVAPMKHPSGDSLTIYADGAVYDETSSKFVNIDSLVRNG